jgi:phage host-nuclease inhibitor protein Gam
MAKAKSKESLPLICALVFFVLTTIAFGVMWYLSYSEVEQAKAEAKNDKNALKGPRDTARQNELKARVYRLYLGIGEDDDKTTVDADRGTDNTINSELAKINEAVAKKMVKDKEPTAENLPEDFKFWKTDANKKAEAPPTEGLLDQYAKLFKKEVAYKEAQNERDQYRTKIGDMKAAIASLDEVKKKFQAQIDTLPEDFKAKLKTVTDGFDQRTLLYKQDQAASNKKNTELAEERDAYAGQVKKLKETIDNLQKDNQQLLAKSAERNKETFTFDEPQGKILRKLPEGVVEINLGSAAGVRPGLTFTVLPPDFPEKGRQSRVRMLRVPDGRGAFKSVESFVPKGSIEVYEVVGPTLSLARIQSGSELDPIRDGVTVGDLIYNSVWRKGVADHVALVGIFDVNGDGSDDIESVVKDLNRMGIPVDAYFDLKKRQWVGQVTERTRYIVEGYFPIQGANDPNREEKTKLIGALADAVKDGKQKGVDTVNFRDFFSRMGYKFRLDVSDDKINQATAPYLSNIGIGNSPVPMPPAP